jgi:hypothetical protein
MKTVTSRDGTTIAYDQVGAGPAVIVLSGGPSDRTANAPLAARVLCGNPVRYAARRS